MTSWRHFNTGSIVILCGPSKQERDACRGEFSGRLDEPVSLMSIFCSKIRWLWIVVCREQHCWYCTAILEETRVGFEKELCWSVAKECHTVCLSDWAEGPTSGQQCRRQCSKWPERSTKCHVPRTCSLTLPTSSTRLKMLQPPEKPHPSQTKMTDVMGNYSNYSLTNSCNGTQWCQNDKHPAVDPGRIRLIWPTRPSSKLSSWQVKTLQTSLDNPKFPWLSEFIAL